MFGRPNILHCLAGVTIKVESPDFDPGADNRSSSSTGCPGGIKVGAGRCEIRPYRPRSALAPAPATA